ncbi:hypothetical protein EON64_04245 [archaeon]|nr:MAG: hypothetical protein EON64_04245 [archaeon]
MKPQGPGSVGKRVVRPCAVHYSNVMLVDPITGYAIYNIYIMITPRTTTNNPTTLPLCAPQQAH